MSDSRALHRLFSPINIGKVRLKNRVVMAPIVTRLGATDGLMTERERAYFIRRAQGGANFLEYVIGQTNFLRIVPLSVNLPQESISKPAIQM